MTPDIIIHHAGGARLGATLLPPDVDPDDFAGENDWQDWQVFPLADALSLARDILRLEEREHDFSDFTGYCTGCGIDKEGLLKDGEPGEKSCPVVRL